MEWQIPVDTLFTQVFGIAQPFIRKFNVDMNEGEAKPRPAYSVIMEEEDEQDEFLTSSLGTPVQFSMAFVESEFRYFQNGEINKKKLSGSYLPFTSVASFTRAKRMTETYMSGHKGSVIEQYGWEPWNIRVQGFIIKNEFSLLTVEKDTSVGAQVKKLQEYEELSDSIPVKGKCFEWLNINKVAIISISYPEARDLDLSVIKPFEINMRSVEPIELIEL